MSINLLGGFAKGFKLDTLNSLNTRPTSVMLKRKIFDSFQSLDQYEFLDLCAGSGSIGLEGISRNARSLLMCESDSKAYRVLKSNSDRFKEKYNSSDIKTIKSDFNKLMSRYEYDENKEYFIFFDPPYEKVKLYEEFFEHLNKAQFNGVVVIEACSQKTKKIDEFEAIFGKFDKVFKQGTSYFGVYLKQIED